MELKLVVKEKGKGKKKTYTANAVDLSFGVVDDTIKALSPEKVDFSDSMALGKAILGAWKQIAPILMELFDGVTEEELRTVKMTNLVEIAQEIFEHLSETISVLHDEKN
jgi:hypothetical protein